MWKLKYNKKENPWHAYTKATTLVSLPFLAFLAGQQTNSTPLKMSMPQGSSMAKERRRIDLSAQAWRAVSKFQHLVWLCMCMYWKGPYGGSVVRGCNGVSELVFFCVCLYYYSFSGMVEGGFIISIQSLNMSYCLLTWCSQHSQRKAFVTGWSSFFFSQFNTFI